MNVKEGVIQFVARHAHAPLAARFLDVAAALDGWRSILHATGAVGQDAGRYEGVAFGNVSVRVPPWPGARGARPFLVTATQTGASPRIGLDELALVSSWDLARNTVVSAGTALPSSESLTHGAIYDLSSSIRAVVHAHAPEVFRARRALALPSTKDDVGYGTVAMAREMERLFRAGTLAETRALAMTGHEDGIITFGRDLDEAGLAFIALLARARSLLSISGGSSEPPSSTTPSPTRLPQAPLRGRQR